MNRELFRQPNRRVSGGVTSKRFKRMTFSVFLYFGIVRTPFVVMFFCSTAFPDLCYLLVSKLTFDWNEISKFRNTNKTRKYLYKNVFWAILVDYLKRKQLSKTASLSDYDVLPARRGGNNLDPNYYWSHLKLDRHRYQQYQISSKNLTQSSLMSLTIFLFLV